MNFVPNHPSSRFPRSIVTFIGDRFSFLPISLLQHSHCTFVIILFRPFRTVQRRSLLLLCALRSYLSHLFLIGRVLTHNDPRKSLHKLCRILGAGQYKSLWVSTSAPRTFVSSIPSPEGFCFARIRLDPLSSQVLYHDSVSMIVSRFTSFIEDFVICCFQVTKVFCSRNGSANATSVRGPCNFGPLVDLAISSLGE